MRLCSIFATCARHAQLGQLLAAAGEICGDLHGRGLWDAEDRELLEAVWKFLKDIEANLPAESAGRSMADYDLGFLDCRLGRLELSQWSDSRLLLCNRPLLFRCRELERSYPLDIAVVLEDVRINSSSSPVAAMRSRRFWPTGARRFRYGTENDLSTADGQLDFIGHFALLQNRLWDADAVRVADTY